MQQEATEQDNFHYLNHDIGTHEMGSFIKGFPGVSKDKAQVYPQMHKQEDH
jgi:hypothetical protein